MFNPRLDTPIAIEKPSTVEDATYGGPSGAFVPWVPRLFVEWQDALPGRSESLRQGLETARNTARVRLRYLSGLDSSMRVIRDGVAYNIVGGPSEIGRREWHEMVVERYATTGGAAA